MITQCNKLVKTPGIAIRNFLEILGVKIRKTEKTELNLYSQLKNTSLAVMKQSLAVQSGGNLTKCQMETRFKT